MLGTGVLTLPTSARAGDNDDWDADLRQVVLTGDEDGTAMGTAVAMGDLNGDGFDDMVISAPDLDGAGTWYGEVYVLFGPEDGSHELTDTSEADAIIVGEADGDHFGHSLAIGDLNGDGVEDLVVGAPFAGSGTVYLFDGDNISSTLAASSADVIIEGDSSGENAGYALAVADLDSLTSGLELAIGARNYGGGDGAVYIFHASTIAWPSSPLDTGADADFVYYGEDEEEAGYALVAAYQNDDDEANLAIGAPEAGSGGEGRVYLLEANMTSYTGPADLSDSSYAIIENEAGTTGFGFALGDAYGHTEDTVTAGGMLPWLVVGAEYVSGSDGDLHFFKDPWDDLSLADTDDATWWTTSGEGYPVTVEGKSFALLRGLCPLGNAVAFGDPDANHKYPHYAADDAGAAYLVCGVEDGSENTGYQIFVSCTSPWDLVFFDTDSGADADRLGWSLAAGDVNGDGVDDLLAGEPRADHNGSTSITGGARLFYGPWRPMDGEVELSDADSILDGISVNDYAGVEITDMGDVNCDGVVDIAIGANRAGYADQGRAYVFFGPTEEGEALGAFEDLELSTADLIFYGDATMDRAGQRIAGVGDLDEDGCDDLIITAPFSDDGATDAGTAYPFYGSDTLGGVVDSTDADATFEHTGASDHFGMEVSGIGDFDGDGVVDLAIGAPDLTVTYSGTAYDLGTVFVFLGSTTRYSGAYTPTSDADCKIVGGESFGTSISGPLDFDGDTYGDLAVGASLYDYGAAADVGTVFVWQHYPCTSSSTVLSGTRDIQVIGEDDGDYLGYSLDVVADLDEDGTDDLVVGAPNPYNVDYPGKAIWVPGGLADGSYTSPAGGLVLSSSTDKENRFGWSVSSGNILWDEEDGDNEVWDQDELPDILVGAPLDDSGYGGAYLYDGSVLAAEIGVSTTLDHITASRVQLPGEASGDWAGGRVGLSEDLNRDGFDDVLVGAWGVDVGSDTNAGMAYILLSTHPTD